MTNIRDDRKEIINYLERVNELKDKMIEKLEKDNEYLRSQNEHVLDHARSIKEEYVLKGNEVKEFLSGVDAIRKAIVNLPLHAAEAVLPRKKHVAIFGKDFSSASLKFSELEQQLKPEITHIYQSSTSLKFITLELEVKAVKFSSNSHGLRLDEIYVDKSLSIESLEIIKTMRRDIGAPIHYF
jgi:hypothetical protein